MNTKNRIFVVAMVAATGIAYGIGFFLLIISNLIRSAMAFGPKQFGRGGK